MNFFYKRLGKAGIRFRTGFLKQLAVLGIIRRAEILGLINQFTPL